MELIPEATMCLLPLNISGSIIIFGVGFPIALAPSSLIRQKLFSAESFSSEMVSERGGDKKQTGGED